MRINWCGAFPSSPRCSQPNRGTRTPDSLAAQPFRHVVIDPFLDPQFCQELIAQFPPFEAGDARNERGEPAGKSVIADIARLGRTYNRFDRLMHDSEFLSLIGRITGVPNLLYDEDYVGGGTHENRDGQELDSHVDFNFHPLGWHRRLNLIVFLNPEWEEAWGGCLELLREPSADSGDACKDACKIIVPLANRAVVFETTESSWHGFRVIRTPPGRGITRKSLAVYFYSHDRPAVEIVPPHGTYDATPACAARTHPARLHFAGRRRSGDPQAV